MNLADCLQAAIDAGDLDPDLGKEAQKTYRNRVKELEGRGLPPELAAKQASDDAAETLTRGIRARRHATAAQMRVMARNVERYSGDPLASAAQLLNDIDMIHSEWKSIRQQVFAGIHDFLKTHKTNVLGSVQKRAMLKEVLRELHGESTGSANAKAIAESVVKQYERLRQLANSYGMDIGKLDDFGVPHTHHAGKILRAGYDAWFAKLYDGRLIDWARIVNFKTGKPFAVAAGGRPFREDADAFLKPIFDQITTKGWINREPSMALAGKGLVAARGEHRVLHFVNADAWMKYNEAFGRTNPFEAIVDHLSGLSRDIALMRGFGVNYKAGLSHATQVIQKAFQTDRTITGIARQKRAEKIHKKLSFARTMLTNVSGGTEVESAFFARFMGTTRTLLVPAQLGSATLSTTTDWVNARSAAEAIGLNPNSPTVAMIKQITSGLSQDQARDLGFILETWHDTLAGQAKLAADIWQPALGDRLASGVLRVTGLNYLTDTSKVAMKASFGADMADLADKAWADLHPNMRAFFESRRVTAEDWDALRDPAVIHTDRKGGRHINPTWFLEHTSLPRDKAEDIAIRWGGMVEEYAETGITTGSLRARSKMIGDTKAGSLSGEVLRSLGMYRGFTFSRLFLFFRRWNEMDGGPTNKYLFAAKYAAMSAVAGAVTLQLKAAANGRDPRPMNDPKFWAAAAVQGGGLGIFGDFLFSAEDRTGGNVYRTLGGPVVGLGAELGTAVVSNAGRAIQGEETFWGRDVVNLARRYNPAASAWPTRLALDRMVWDQLQSVLDPEAEVLWRRAEKRLKREYGTQSWWRKGQMLPDRAPDLANALPP